MSPPIYHLQAFKRIQKTLSNIVQVSLCFNGSPLSLCKVATARTQEMKSNANSIRAAHWKEVIGVTVESESTRKPRPTKAAYRYVRGNEGWVSSLIAPSSWNNAVQGEDETNRDSNENE